jgi:hypothetical protein
MSEIKTKYEITYNGGVIEDPENPGQTLFFDSKEDAESYISAHELPPDECDILAVVIDE